MIASSSRHHVSSFLFIPFFSLSCLMLGVEALRAQPSAESTARWTLAPGLTYYRINDADANGWGIGPVLTTAYRGGSGLGGELTIGVIVSSNGRYDFSGIHADLGIAYTVVRRAPVDVAVAAGATALAGGDSDGTQGVAAGGYVAACGHLWLSDWAGFSLRTAARYMPQEFNALFSPSVAVGLGFRF